jgi:hypothetical protein
MSYRTVEKCADGQQASCAGSRGTPAQAPNMALARSRLPSASSVPSSHVSACTRCRNRSRILSVHRDMTRSFEQVVLFLGHSSALPVLRSALRASSLLSSISRAAVERSRRFRAAIDISRVGSVARSPLFSRHTPPFLRRPSALQQSVQLASRARCAPITRLDLT